MAEAAPDALILAGGRGERLGMGLKAFVALNGATLLEWAIRAVRPAAGRIMVAVPAGTDDDARRLLPPEVIVLVGGATRIDTIAILVESATSASLLMHDVVHPLADRALVARVIEGARDTGAACAAIPLSGSVRRSSAGALGAPIDGPLWLATKPAVVPRDAVRHGIAIERRRPTMGHFGVLDLVGRSGIRIVTVPSDPANLKITDEVDLRLAERLAPKWTGWG
ncbi:MAG: 2-C-methyl-D-erythritol 4-phosphate cytidylyltransferase [Candidatus Limnocylindrales bacterium]